MSFRLDRFRKATSAYYLVILISLLWFMVQFLRYVFPPLFDTFQVTYEISNTQTGFLFTLIMLSYAVVQFPAGVLGDRFGLPSVILSGGIIFTVASLFVAVSPSFVILACMAALIGLGTGPHKTIAIPLLSRQYTEHPGRVLGVMDTVGQLGGMSAPIVVVLITTLTIWRNVFVLGAVVSAILLFLFYRVIRHDSSLKIHARSSNQRAPERYKSTDSYLRIFDDRELLLFIFVAICFTFTWNGVSSFLPLFLTVEKEISASTTGLLYSLLFVMAVSQIATGEISDQIGSINISIILFLIMTVGVVWLVIADTIVMVGSSILVIGLGIHGFRPVRDAYLMQLIPEGSGGGALGAIRTGMTGVGALAPMIVGLISDIVGFVWAFLLIGGVTTLAGVVTVFLSNRQG